MYAIKTEKNFLIQINWAMRESPIERIWRGGEVSTWKLLKWNLYKLNMEWDLRGPYYFRNSPITYWLGIHFTPRQCHWFEYQTPIKATSLGLFEHHHAVRGRWAAQGKGSWNYWVKILMEWSQSPSRCSQRLMLMFSELGYILATLFFNLFLFI